MSEPRRPYISELRTQIEMIDDALRELDEEVICDAFGPKYTKEQREKRRTLLKRRAEIRKQIIDAKN